MVLNSADMAGPISELLRASFSRFSKFIYFGPHFDLFYVLDVSTHLLCFVFGDLVSGPWGSIPGPGEGLLRGFWTPEQI